MDSEEYTQHGYDTQMPYTKFVWNHPALAGKSVLARTFATAIIMLSTMPVIIIDRIKGFKKK